MSLCRICARIATVSPWRTTVENGMNGERSTGYYWYKQVSVQVRQRFSKRMRHRKVCVKILINALKVLANQQKDGDSPIQSIITGFCERSRKGIIEGLRRFTYLARVINCLVMARDVSSFASVTLDPFPAKSTSVLFWSTQCKFCLTQCRDCVFYVRKTTHRKNVYFFRNFESPHFCTVFSTICGTVVENIMARFQGFWDPWPTARNFLYGGCVTEQQGFTTCRLCLWCCVSVCGECHGVSNDVSYEVFFALCL